MLCDDLLGIIVLYVHDWETIINMYNVSKSWRKQICHYTGSNISLTSGVHKNKTIFELIVAYPSYLEYLAKEFYSPYVTKILKTVQCRCNVKFIRMPYGKYKGELINNIPRQYMQWLIEQKNTTDVYVKRTMIKLLRQDNYIPYHPRKRRKYYY